MEIVITDIAGIEYYIGDKEIKAIQGKDLANIRNICPDNIYVMINDIKVPVKYTDYVVKFNDDAELCILNEKSFNALTNM